MANTELEYNYLGKSSLKVSNICLGTSVFGPQQHEYGSRPGCDDATAIELMNYYVKHGGNFIDTSDMYSHGDSERVVGKWLNTQERDRLVITTKVCSPIDKTNPNCIGLGRKHICSSIDKSLKNLQTGYVDQYMMHNWDNATSLKETLRTFNDLIRCGKIRHIGVCNFSGHHLQKCVDFCEFMGLDPVVNIQAEYSLLTRSLEWEVIDVCKTEGVSLTPWGVLKGGFLTGKLKRNEAPPADSRIAWATANNVGGITSPQMSRFADDKQYWQIMDNLNSIAADTGRTVPEVAMKWCIQKDFVPSIVAGVRNERQLKEALQAGSSTWALTTQQMSALNEASEPVLPDSYKAVKRWYQFRARTPCK